MSTHTQTSSSRAKKGRSRRARRSTRRASPAATTVARKQTRRSARAVAEESRTKLPPSDQVVAAVRKELTRLTKRWKNLLPQLRQAKGKGATPTRRRRTAKRRASA